MILRLPWLAGVLAALAPAAAFAAIPVWGVEVVRAFPHDRASFTEGLFYLNGWLYESAGQNVRPAIRRVELATGRVVQGRDIAPLFFGEGIVAWKGRLIQLTWKNHIGFIYDLKSFEPLGTFNYPGEGWALTTDGRRIIMSDGSPQLRFLDPATLKEAGRLTVTANGAPVKDLNELEWVRGQIWANIWLTNRIARIDPASGKVVGWIDLTGLISPRDVRGDPDAVANGIAYDATHDRVFVTGKLWPRLFEIRLVRR
ncbi:MAG TPA: glutaminyl-peptide cyclotransferase [Caulobacteraceae bacterium]